MKKILLLCVLSFQVTVALSQKTYVYEMSINRYNVGYYCVEYTKTPVLCDNPLVIYFYNDRQPLYHLHVDFVTKCDTVRSITDTDGCVYLDRQFIKPNQMLKIIIHQSFRTIEYSVSIVHFWEWKDVAVPAKINVSVAMEYPCIAHIRSPKPLSSQDMEELKNAILNNNLSEIKSRGVELSLLIHL